MYSTGPTTFDTSFNFKAWWCIYNWWLRS